ncbi:glycerophosphodiester phosphodiesterase family protein [Jiangella ureilytica]|uniref:Glycerophosphodiester phosphodiesterase family protein n=1 Tax=Jiangella ureilytica TaxID=2530374 RepID=A0A4V2XXI7_9ACTN|nr:glycerophosphodiester phosphodiesterase family protein [Jiangella ureilytica]TDC53455.1 glycerophosphodiester phosphodiesterase family protein [Jiangella ureilytica]
MAVRTLRRTATAAVTIALLTGLAAAQAGAEGEEDPRIQQYREALAQLRPLTDPPACDQVPEPGRWADAGAPDQGSADAVISAHRGALTLAPENTLQSYEYAFAYGVDLVEVDVQQTEDGRFVALHDSTVDRTTNGTGNIADLTFDEVRALNAADYAPWSGGAYDPAQVASLEEVLELAQRAGKGVELDIKGSVTEEGELAELVGEYGLIEESIFNSADPRVFVAEPAARLIYNRDAWEPAFLIYEVGEVFKVFGSRLDEYTPESIAAAHDACAIVMPHAYDAGPDQEVAQFLQARAMGADGVQTNQPALIVAAAGEAVDSTIEVERGEHGRIDEICLVNADNGFGFPGKPVRFQRGDKSAELTTGRGGCVATPPGHWQGARVTFAGDGAVHASAARLAPSPD